MPSSPTLPEIPLGEQVPKKVIRPHVRGACGWDMPPASLPWEVRARWCGQRRHPQSYDTIVRSALSRVRGAAL